MVVERSERRCLLCNRAFEGRTFLCRECSDRYRDAPVSIEVRERFYEALDRAYPDRSNTYGAYNEPAGLLRAADRLPRDVRILEVGAGGGFLGMTLWRMGFQNLTLSDFTSTTLDELSRRLPEAHLVSADAADLPFRGETFEVVISSDLIEHIPQVEEHIAEVRRVLVPGGLCLIKTPNRRIADAYYRLRGMHDSYFWHPSMFSPAEIQSTFQQHGFEVRFLAHPRLTGAQLTKLPGPQILRRLASPIPLAWIPVALQPHLEIVARKRD